MTKTVEEIEEKLIRNDNIEFRRFNTKTCDIYRPNHVTLYFVNER